MAQPRHNPFLLPSTWIRGFAVKTETSDLEEVFIEEGAPSAVRTPALAPCSARQQMLPASTAVIASWDAAPTASPGDPYPRTRTRRSACPATAASVRQVPTSPSRCARPRLVQPVVAERRTPSGSSALEAYPRRPWLDWWFRGNEGIDRRRQVAAPLRHGTGVGDEWKNLQAYSPPETVTDGPAERVHMHGDVAQIGVHRGRDPRHAAAPFLRRREPQPGTNGASPHPGTLADLAAIRSASCHGSRSEGIDIRLAL